MTADKRDDIDILNALIEAGWVLKSKAVDYCEVCKYCKGRGFYNDYIEDCSTCQGKGILLKDIK